MAAKTPAQKREQEKQTVGLMIELYCHATTVPGGMPSARTGEALRSYAVPGWTTARTLRPRPSAVPARLIATSPRCGRPSDRSCAGAAADDLPPPRPGDTAFDRDEKTEKVICPCK